MLYAQVHLTLPAWIHDQIDLDRRYPGDEAKVALAIELSRLNVEHASGGPFVRWCSDRTTRSSPPA